VHQSSPVGSSAGRFPRLTAFDRAWPTHGGHTARPTVTPPALLPRLLTMEVLYQLS
jgi:hypothetical protein